MLKLIFLLIQYKNFLNIFWNFVECIRCTPYTYATSINKPKFFKPRKWKIIIFSRVILLRYFFFNVGGSKTSDYILVHNSQHPRPPLCVSEMKRRQYMYNKFHTASPIVLPDCYFHSLFARNSNTTDVLVSVSGIMTWNFC